MAKPNANEDLSAYLDGELTDAEMAELEAELARDPDLRADLQALEGVVQFLREEGPDMAPLGFHHRVMERIEQEHPQRPSFWAWLRRPFGLPLEGWLVALAAAAVLLFVLPRDRAPEDSDAWTVTPPEPADGSPAAIKEPVLEREPEVAPPAVEIEAPAPKKLEKKLPAPPPQVDPKPLPEPLPTAEEPQGTADEPPASSRPMASPGYRYVVRSTSPDMKLALLKVASRYGGATSPGGAEITDAAMSANVEELLVQVPQADLTRFARELEALGYEVVKEPTSEIVAGSTIPVRITLQLVGGATDAPNAAPNATRQKRMQLDELEAIEPGE